MPRALIAQHARAPHRVAMVAYPDAQILDITGPLEVFARCARWLRDHAAHRMPAYSVELLAREAGPVVTSGGVQLLATRSYRAVRSIDTLLVSGGIGYRTAADDAQLLEWLRRQSGRVARIGSICTGALVLAAAGLLDGRRVTTHWAYCERLARAVPGCTVEPDAIFVRAGKLYTSAGVTAGMDLALAMVEEDWGKTVALAVAQELVMFLQRPGGQSQFSRHLHAARRDDRFGELELWMLEHLDADLSVEALAARATMSARHFARRFVAEFGTTPAAYVRRLRVEGARRRLESGAMRLKDLARQCGFADEQALRRAFQQALGVTPAEYRARFGRK